MCQEGFEINSLRNKCSNGSIPNCMVYSNSGECGSCRIGFEASTDKRNCTPSIANCVQFDSNTNCTKC